MPAKRKVSLSLDADLVEELERDPGEALSAQITAALRAAVERRRQRALRQLLDQLDAQDGPLVPEDEVEIERYRRALEP
jgi:hypothetical protein